eukprot:TRINITY_DN50811_c0_g1_i1.p1 TRINITY_DN50811_c0_g1~~TRINITY_DN50811_c0_g1_i1.p1  ORF type:complete len:938 (+),score=345.38 TRINITY_DN50811_c0_g1_i1:95-2815(+)
MPRSNDSVAPAIDTDAPVIAGSPKADAESEWVFDDDEDAEAEGSIPVRGFGEYLAYDVKRMYTTRALPVFLVALLLTTLSAGLSLPIPAEQGDGYYNTETVTKDLMQAEAFRACRTPAAFYSWLRSVAAQMWVPQAQMPPNRTAGLPTHLRRVGLLAERQNIPLYWLVVRQHRVEREGCGGGDEADPVDQGLWSLARKECYPEYRRDRLSAVGYRPVGTAPPTATNSSTGDPFVADGFKTALSGTVMPPPLQYAQGRVRDWYGDGAQFTLTIPYQWISQEDANAAISDLESNGWIDFATRMVVVETILFNPQGGLHPPYGTFTMVRFTMEYHYSGLPQTLATVRPFRLLLLNRWVDTLVFICDMLLLLYLPWLLRDIVWHVYTNWRLAPWTGLFGLLELLSTLHLVLLFAALCYRWIVISESHRFPGNLAARGFYSEMAEYQHTYERGRNFYIAALWITWARVLEFLRFNGRLNAVTETVRLAATDLFSLFVVTAIVLFTFALVGNGIYGRHVKAFATLSDSFEWLVTAVFTADIEGADYTYSAMKALEPEWTPLFVIVFFGLSWLILLNVVLGILATGFSAASQSTTDRTWDPRSIQQDAGAWWNSESSGGCCEHFWPFSSPYVDRRVQASHCLRATLEAEERSYEAQDAAIPAGKRWKRKPFDPHSVRRSKRELLHSARTPQWGLTVKETAQGYDECAQWWKGNLSDIASQSRSEKDELRAQLQGLAHNLSAFSASVEARFSALEAENRTLASRIRDDQTVLRARHDAHQQALDRLAARLGGGAGAGAAAAGGYAVQPPPAPPAGGGKRAASLASPPPPGRSGSVPAAPLTPTVDFSPSEAAARADVLAGQMLGAEALYRGEWLPCTVVRRKDDGTYLITWEDGSWTDGVQGQHIRPRDGPLQS